MTAPIAVRATPRPIDVVDRASSAGGESLAGKAAPYVVILAILWILRRLFGGSDD